ncbi:MAG: PAS domain S-box protein [Hyphomonadaceae bacterium]
MTQHKHEILDALPVAVYLTDAEGRITYFNDAAAELWGHRPKLGDLWCGSWKLFHPDGRPLPHDQCPMALALKERRPIRGVEAVLERPDGVRIPFAPYPSPIFDENGVLVGGVNLLLDVSQRHRDEEDSARLAAIVASSDDAIVSKTLQGFITSWNAGATRIFGYEADEIIGRHITTLIPPELHDEEKDIIARLTRGERIEHFETERVTKDGRRIDVSLTVSPVRDSTGRIIGASKVGRDISDRKRAEETQRLLLDELSHRIKNTLATVQAIASQTLRRAGNPEHFVASFNGRIKALARAHSLLSGGSFQSADVSDLVREQLLLGGEDDHRISWSGPSVMMDAQASLHLALVLHELGTNARKHGALSSPGGRVAVRWHVKSNGNRCLQLYWRETGGPPVAAPTSRGFGSVLIEQSLQAHGGDVILNYAENGLSCEISLPLPELTQPIGPLSGSANAADALAPGQRPVLKGKRVLVIEDEPLIGMVLADYLADAGCEVVGPAPNIDKAKALVAESNIDAALVDGNLAGRPVDEVAIALKSRNVPFAFVTGYGRGGLPEGFADAPIVEKPFTQEQVVTTLERLFSNVVRLRRRR